MLLYLQLLEEDEDRLKFEQIYLAYRDLMYTTANHALHHKEDSEDVVHQAFLKLLPYVHTIREPVSQSTKRLLMTITEHETVNVFRQRRRLGDLIDYDAVQIPWNLPDQVLEGDPVASCIMELPRSQRHVICLKYDLGRSLREIAEMLDISLCAVQRTDQRAKKKLKDLLKEGNE